jgi:hypothetical protein
MALAWGRSCVRRFSLRCGLGSQGGSRFAGGAGTPSFRRETGTNPSPQPWSASRPKPPRGGGEKRLGQGRVWHSRGYQHVNRGRRQPAAPSRRRWRWRPRSSCRRSVANAARPHGRCARHTTRRSRRPRPGVRRRICRPGWRWRGCVLVRRAGPACARYVPGRGRAGQPGLSGTGTAGGGAEAPAPGHRPGQQRGAGACHLGHQHAGIFGPIGVLERQQKAPYLTVVAQRRPGAVESGGVSRQLGHSRSGPPARCWRTARRSGQVSARQKFMISVSP